MDLLKQSTRKTLIAQTSDQLYNKLSGEKLMGLSKEIALEILTERKQKGKFDKDISHFFDKKQHVEEKNEQVVKKENVKKEKSVSKKLIKFPNFKAKFKKGQNVQFIPFRDKKLVKGEVISSYPVERKRGEEYIEAVKIRVGNNIYEKNATALELVE